MHVDVDQLDGEYPPEPECQVNSSDCSFTPVTYLCHECGRKLCTECAVGIRHQPQIFKYAGIDRQSDERVQMHCPDCADAHGYNTTILAATGGVTVLGVVLLGFGATAMSPAAIVVGLVLAAAGGYFLNKERKLKTKLSADQIGS